MKTVWEKDHESSWDRVKDALKRDWEQTKNHFTDSGKELHQNLADTVKQAVGADPIPSASRPVPDTGGWLRVEPAVRFGYCAHLFHAQDHETREPTRLTEDIEDKLKSAWTNLHPLDWTEPVRDSVIQGWNYATEHLRD